MGETSDTFTNATGHVYVRGQEVPEIRAVGFVHRHPCQRHAVATVEIGGPFGCDCGGTVLMGWRDWWPLPNDPPQSLVIDMGASPEPATTEGRSSDG
jgi:hypothetical protein